MPEGLLSQGVRHMLPLCVYVCVKIMIIVPDEGHPSTFCQMQTVSLLIQIMTANNNATLCLQFDTNDVIHDNRITGPYTALDGVSCHTSLI